MNGKMLLCTALAAATAGATRCETGFAKGASAQCFLDEPLKSLLQDNRWGWSNALRKADLPVTLEVWGGAADCDLSLGIHQANVEVRAAGAGKVELEVVPLAGATVSEVHAYAGSTPMPMKRQGPNLVPTSNPGQFPQQSTSSLGPFVFDVNTDDFYVVLHTDACGPAACTPAASTTATVTVNGQALPVSEAGATTWQVGGQTVTLDSPLPEHLLGAEVKGYAVADQTTPTAAGAEIEVTCPANCEGASCSVTIVTYHCPPCSGGVNGGLTPLLRTQGVTVGSCAPGFVVGGGQRFKMVGHHVQVAEGEKFSFLATTKPLQHYAVFVRHNVDDCSTATDSDTCVALDRCGWNAAEQVCRSRWCAGMKFTPPATGGQCLTCAPTA